MAKNTIRLTESELKRVITESVRRVLKEHDLMPGDNGGYFSTSEFVNSQNRTWRGVPGTKVMWHGEWSDYEVIYNTEVLNGNDLDDYAWSLYKDETPNGSEDEFNNLPSKWFAHVLENFINNY